ncbi:hypothetical protein TWF694_011615 [Orbilia ellipsospora]|uniref:Uncharacterized protein n=1 Tax=Orbilia ellipsospora TaxID=2528407 RepID=A0AAV9X5S0_9PEZI
MSPPRASAETVTPSPVDISQNGIISLSPDSVAAFSETPISAISPVLTSRSDHPDSEEDQEENEEENKTSLLIDDMCSQIQAVYKSATVGYLDSGRLKKELRRAKKAHRAKEKQLDMQIELLCRSNNALKAKLATVEEDCKALTAEKQSMEEKFKSEQQAIEGEFTSEQRANEEIITSEQQTFRDKIDQLQKDHYALQETNTALETRNSELTDERDSLRATGEECKKWAETMESKIISLDKYINDQNKEVKTLKEKKEELLLQVATMGVEFKTTRENYSKREAILEEITKILAEEKGALVAQNEALIAEKEKYKTQMNSLWKIIKPAK